MYKRISSAEDQEELHDLQVEMIDRFGMLPKSLKRLFHLTELKQKADYLGINKIDSNSSFGNIYFSQHTSVDPSSIINLVQSAPNVYKLSNAHQLHFSYDSDDPELRLGFVDNVLQELKVVI